MIYDEYKGKDFVDLGENNDPMNIITQNNVLKYLKKFGDQNWAKINFKKFSRIGAVKHTNYDFSLRRLLLENN